MSMQIQARHRSFRAQASLQVRLFMNYGLSLVLIYISLKVEIDGYKDKIEKLELQNKSCNLELSELKNKIEKVEGDIKKSIEQKESVEHNTKIQKEIDKYKENLKEIEDLIYDTTETIIDVSGDVKIAENTIKTVNDSINRLGEMERKYEGYEYYLKSVKRDGIPYELISEVLPKLEVALRPYSPRSKPTSKDSPPLALSLCREHW